MFDLIFAATELFLSRPIVALDLADVPLQEEVVLDHVHRLGGLLGLLLL